MDLKTAIRKLAENGDEVYAKVCKVISVDTDERTCECEPLDGSADIPGVRLQADTEGTAGFLIMPKVGSFVIVNFLNADAAFVALTYDIEFVHLFGDKFGGLVKIEELVNKINTIEKSLNDLKTAFKNWTTTPNDGGAALKTITATWFAKQLQTTSVSDLENKNVKHG